MGHRITVTCDDDTSLAVLKAVATALPDARYLVMPEEVSPRGPNEIAGGVAQWLAQPHPAWAGARVTTGELHEGYRIWALSAGFEPMSKIAFARALSARGIPRWLTATARGFILPA